MADAKVKRPLWRRIVRVLTRTLGVLVVLVVIVIALLHTSWGKSFVRGRVEQKLAALVNGEVKLASLDYSFMFGDVELGGLEIRDATGKPAISIGTIYVDLDRSSILDGKPLIEDLRIEGVDVTIVQTADGRSNLTGLFKPSDRKPLEQLRVAQLAVSGKATVERPDGTTIAVHDLAIAGSVEARPAAKEVDALLSRLAAKVDITKPGAPPRSLDVALDAITIGRRKDAIDVDIGAVAAGAIGIEKLGAHVKLADGQLRGAQSITIGKARVDSKQLAALVGKPLLLDDVAIDIAVTGPEDKLAIHGAIKTRDTTLAIDGVIDLSKPARPAYQLAVVGKGKSTDVLVPDDKRKLPAVATDVRIDIKGAGTSPLDVEAELGIVLGPTTIGKVAVDSVAVKATANRGAYRLDSLAAKGLGFEIDATGELAVDRTLRGRLHVNGSPAKAMKILGDLGIAIPPKVPALQQLDVVVTAAGKLDGELAVQLEPTRIAIAGGEVTLAGTATLDHKKLRDASAKIGLARLDLATLARLAGRPPKVAGKLSGTLAVVRTPAGLDADYDLAIALVEPAVVVDARGRADATSASTHARILRAGDRAVLATIDGKLPLANNRLLPGGRWQIAVDVARRPLAEIKALVPERLRERIPVGDVELHVALAGSPLRPTGTIVIGAVVAEPARPAQTIDLKATLAPDGNGLAVALDGTVGVASIDGTVARVGGRVTMPAAFAGAKLDIARLRAGLVADVTIDLPERELASLASLRPKLAELGGKVGGRIAVRGPIKTPALDAKLRWSGYGTAAGGPGETTIAATGTLQAISATIDHNGALAVKLDVDRSNPDRIGVRASAKADTPLLALVPAFAAGKLPAAELGRLRWDMAGTFALARGPTGLALDTASVTGTLAVTGGAFAIPNTNRRYHDIALAVVGDPAGLRIESLTAHETDVEKPDRRIAISGLLAMASPGVPGRAATRSVAESMDNLKPKRVSLELAATDWLLFGTPTFGAADAPRAAATFAIGVEADLTAPVIAVDAIVHSLTLYSPDRAERGHQGELASVSGDIIFVDGKSAVGRLPITPPEPVAAPKPRRPIDIRVHIPKPIHLVQTPFDVMATGELAVTVRDAGITTRGGLVMPSGSLSLFGHDHALVDGKLSFTEEHPKGWLELTFERPLPDVAMRELASRSGGARVTFAGPPTKPKTALGGAAGAALVEVMAMYNAGRPVNVARPGLPASNTVQAPRGDQLFVLTFMAQNLPHLLFLDRINAWADPYDGAGAYGRIAHVEAESYSRDDRRRVKAVVRPNVPGRSTAELQWDRVLVNDDRRAFGVGVRAGDRIGGGVGLFFEWSSKE